MKCLAIETATAACSVAVVAGEKRLQRLETGPRIHAGVLLPWIAELLAEAGLDYADLEGIAVDRGPGGFTSLRLGLGVAQGIGLGHEQPVWPVSSLAALAFAARPPGYRGRMLAALDARMGEVYAGWFSFDEDRMQRIGDEILCAPGELTPVGESAPVGESTPAGKLTIPGEVPFIAAGNALTSYGPEIRAALGAGLQREFPAASPTALAVADLASRAVPVAAHELAPIYLRDRVTG